MIRSIRFSLTIWYVVILTAILTIFSWILYDQVSSVLFQDVDHVLASRADSVSDSLYAFWKAEQEIVTKTLEKGAVPQAITIYEEMSMGGVSDLINRWLQEAGRLELEYPLRLVDREGKILHASRHFIDLKIPLADSSFEQAIHGHEVFQSIEIDNHALRVITFPVIESGHLLFLVQTAVSINPINGSLSELKTKLFILIPLTLIFASSVGWFLAALALKPVDQMTRGVQRIKLENLHERLEVPGSKDELQSLAVTFNEMLDRLEFAFKRIRQFSAAASHELRTPLTVLKGEIELALRKQRDSEAYREVLNTNLEAINEMISIVGELLSLARSGTAQAAVEWNRIALGEIVRKVAQHIKTLADEKQIVLSVDISGDVRIRGEQLLIERLISNLLDNAIKHTPPGGQISVTVYRRNQEAYCEVKDTGPGISAEEMPHIFDRFFQKRPSEVAGDPKSTGLGLGLCRWIAELHRGGIDVSSDIGKGAQFIVHFPLSSS